MFLTVLQLASLWTRCRDKHYQRRVLLRLLRVELRVVPTSRASLSQTPPPRRLRLRPGPTSPLPWIKRSLPHQIQMALQMLPVVPTLQTTRPSKISSRTNDSLRSVPDDIDRNSSTASTSPRASGASNAATTSPVGNDDDSSTASNSGGDAGASGGSYAGNNSTVGNDEDNDREVATLTHDVANMGPNALDENGNWQSKARCDKCLIDFDNAAAFQTHFAEHHHGLQITLPLDEAVSRPARLHLSNQDVSSANLLLSLHSSRNSSRASSPPSTASPTETQPPESLTPQPTHNAPSTPPAPTPNPTLSALSTSAAPIPPVPTPPRPHISRSCPSLSDFTNSVNAAGVLICLSLLM